MARSNGRTVAALKVNADRDAAAHAKLRAEFERWASGRGMDVRARDGDVDYFAESTFYAWLGFEAARTVRS